MSDDVTQVTARVIDVLEALGVPYLIGGSLASTLHGVARTTLDSDIVADLQPEHVAPFIQSLREEFYLSPTAVVEAVALRTSFNLIHLATAFKVDIFLPTGRPFDLAQMQRAQAELLDATTGRTARFASAEDTLLAKLAWYALGGEQAERVARRAGHCGHPGRCSGLAIHAHDGDNAGRRRFAGAVAKSGGTCVINTPSRAPRPAPFT